MQIIFLVTSQRLQDSAGLITRNGFLYKGLFI